MFREVSRVFIIVCNCINSNTSIAQVTEYKSNTYQLCDLGQVTSPLWASVASAAKRNKLVAQSYLTLCDPVDCSPSGSSVHGILQARILQWVAIPFSRGSSRPRDRTWILALQIDSLPSEPPGRPLQQSTYIKKLYETFQN